MRRMRLIGIVAIMTTALCIPVRASEGEPIPAIYCKSIDLLERCVEAEAGNQSILGKQLVADVILNRVNDPDFPDTITDVIKQKGQFSVVSNGSIDSVSVSAETKEAVKKELVSQVNEEVIFFQTGSFSPYGEDFEKVGDHYFSVK